MACTVDKVSLLLHRCTSGAHVLVWLIELIWRPAALAAADQGHQELQSQQHHGGGVLQASDAHRGPEWCWQDGECLAAQQVAAQVWPRS